jgi:two-component system, OmpR family, sensor histidine kinase CpxA
LGEPFFRPESARARETGGVGLGLSIVRAGVEACGGTVKFANREPHGLRVTLRLAVAAGGRA